MRSLITALLLLIMWGPQSGAAGEVESVRFKTSVTPPVYHVPAALKHSEAMFRRGLQTLPEGLLVVGALMVGGGDLGLSQNQSTNLLSLVADVYTQIYSDSDFTGVSSALPYCFATRRHSQGHYFMYRPDKLPEDPACIVFLHGYGGNFMFYTWVLKEEFPDAIILVPSWSVSWAHGSSLYLRDMLKDAERRTGVSLERPWLMGISAGGYGGFSIYNRCSSHFRGYVCIASAPANAVAYALKPDLRILMLNGLDDAMAPIAVVRRQAGLVKKRGISFFRYRELDGNHFFLLSNRKATFDAIRAFMSDAAR